MGSEESTASRYSGLVKLVLQVNKHEIEPEAFMKGVYAFFGQVDESYKQLKQAIASLGNRKEDNFYVDSLLDDVEDTYYIMRLGLMQFEKFVNNEEASGLRVGMELVVLGLNSLEDITSRTNAVATGDNLYSSKDAICAVGSEVMQGKLNVRLFPKAMQQLREIFDPLKEKAESIQEEIINSAKELIDYDGSPEKLHEKAREVREKLPKLEDAYGYLVVATAAPDHVKRVVAHQVLDGNLRNEEPASESKVEPDEKKE